MPYVSCQLATACGVARADGHGLAQRSVVVMTRTWMCTAELRRARLRSLPRRMTVQMAERTPVRCVSERAGAGRSWLADGTALALPAALRRNSPSSVRARTLRIVGLRRFGRGRLAGPAHIGARRVERADEAERRDGEGRARAASTEAADESAALGSRAWAGATRVPTRRDKSRGRVQTRQTRQRRINSRTRERSLRGVGARERCRKAGRQTQDKQHSVSDRLHALRGLVRRWPGESEIATHLLVVPFARPRTSQWSRRAG